MQAAKVKILTGFWRTCEGFNKSKKKSM